MSNSLKGVVAQQLLRSADGTRRYAAFEILLYSPALSIIIRAGVTNKIISFLQTGRKAGMIAMDDYLMELVKSAKVTKQAAFMKAIDKARFHGEAL